MKVMNNRDTEVKFYNDEIEKAKAYFMLIEDLNNDDYLGDDWKDYLANVKECNKEIENSETLEELAEVLNRWASYFDYEGSYEVREL